MIAIKREPAPKFLTDPAQKWYKETQSAISYYQNEAHRAIADGQNNNAEAFDFQHYNDKKLKEELSKFFFKCAYCESSYGAVFDGDVEHFRPKGKVREKNPQIPGYYWLSNDWDNLFIACQHCNQSRRHILYGEEVMEAYGKVDQFPLDPEANRLTGPPDLNTPFDEEEKARLLINPCKDNPEDHFAYEKTHGVIIPLTKMGEASVKVFVLQRPKLVRERNKVLIRLFKQIAITKFLLIQMNTNPTNAANKQAFDMALDSLLDFTRDEAVYAGMSRFFVRQFLIVNALQ